MLSAKGMEANTESVTNSENMIQNYKQNFIIITHFYRLTGVSHMSKVEHRWNSLSTVSDTNLLLVASTNYNDNKTLSSLTLYFIGGKIQAVSLASFTQLLPPRLPT